MLTSFVGLESDDVLGDDKGTWSKIRIEPHYIGTVSISETKKFY